MKTLNILFALLLTTGLNFSASAIPTGNSQVNKPSTKTESFKVWGKCEMCKARIENAVKADGATEAVWDVKTQMLTVKYDPSRTNKEKLSKKLASVGHDTEKYKAPDEVYNALPGCCHYERTK